MPILRAAVCQSRPSPAGRIGQHPTPGAFGQPASLSFVVLQSTPKAPPAGRDPECCTAVVAVRVSEFAMNDVVEGILNAYQLMRPLDAERVSDSRLKITKYIESLSTAGHRDAEQLTIYGLAYLKELHEGRDPRFTGC